MEESERKLIQRHIQEGLDLDMYKYNCDSCKRSKMDKFVTVTHHTPFSRTIHYNHHRKLRCGEVITTPNSHCASHELTK